MTAIILPKLGNCINYHDAMRMLEGMGAQQVGSGHFSKVYRVETYVEPRTMSLRPSPLSIRDITVFDANKMRYHMDPVRIERTVRIIKVCCKPDRAALLVAKAAMATCEIDPLAPKYYGVTEFGGGFWIAELEPLSECHEGPSEAHQRFTGERWKYAPTAELIATSPYLSILQAYHLSDPGTMDSGSGYRWDLHGANVMMRGAQPVITDPMCHNADV